VIANRCKVTLLMGVYALVLFDRGCVEMPSRDASMRKSCTVRGNWSQTFGFSTRNKTQSMARVAQKLPLTPGRGYMQALFAP